MYSLIMMAATMPIYSIIEASVIHTVASFYYLGNQKNVSMLECITSVIKTILPVIAISMIGMVLMFASRCKF